MRAGVGVIGVTARRFISSIRCSMVVALALCITACSGAPAARDQGLSVAVKPNKTYVIEGRTVYFGEIEALLASMKPRAVSRSQACCA